MNELLERISVDPTVCHGKPVVKGTRVMVWQIIGFLAAGDSVEEVLKEYPQLSPEDVRACLAFAAETTKERVLPVNIAS
jgi:uncharacterized protein (DUF433 family)